MRQVDFDVAKRAERRPRFSKPARIPLGDRQTYPFGEGHP